MCTHPLKLDDRTVACGHCIECLIKKSQEWAFRLEQESKTASSGIFLTLTYDDNSAIWIDCQVGDDEHTHYTMTTLSKKDCQDFIKRLRKAQGPLKNKQDYREKLRYFMCGEYGPSTGRAHYHAIIFNLKENVINQLEEKWGKGQIKVGQVTPKSIRYVTNYMLLKEKTSFHEQTDPFILMSKKPILGANYVVKNHYHHTENLDGKLVHAQKNRRTLYKCYERKIFNENEQKYIKENREEDLKKYLEERRNLYKEKQPLDPFGAEKQERKHKAYILSKRQIKRKL